MITVNELKDICIEMQERNMTNPSGMAQVLFYHILKSENK